MTERSILFKEVGRMQRVLLLLQVVEYNILNIYHHASRVLYVKVLYDGLSFQHYKSRVNAFSMY